MESETARHATSRYAEADGKEEEEAVGIADIEGEPTEEAQQALYHAAIASLPDISEMSKDDIFQKAVDAAYWAGYWASAYKVRSLGSTYGLYI